MKRRWFFRIEFKPQDCWVGVFWRSGPRFPDFGPVAFDCWICVLPMIPLHFGWDGSVEHG
jgi:hypothetical protein